MLNESKTEEKISFVVIIFIIGDISVAGFLAPPPLAGPAPRGHIGVVPPQIAACAPQTRNVPPKRGLCPKEINRLGATGVQFGA